MFCPKCSSNIDDNSSFCPVCGLDIVDYDNKLKEEAENFKSEDATSKINAISTFDKFADIYKGKYTDLFSMHESFRLKKLSQYKLYKYLYAPLSIFILIGMWYFVPIMDYTIPLIFVSLFLVIMLIFNLIRCKTNFTKKYTDELKEPYSKFIYECFGIKSTVPYKWDKMFSLLKKSDLFFDFDTIDVSKSYGFIFDNNKIHIEDLVLTTGSIGNKWLIFDGTIVTIENKNVRDCLLSKITAKTLKTKPILIYILLLILMIFGILSGIPLENFIMLLRYQNLLFLPIILFLIVIFLIRNKQDCLNINNKEFSKKYIVESLDTKEAEKHNTSDFYNLLKDFEYAYDTKNIKIANYENKTVIAIGTNKKFLDTADLRHSLYNPQCFEKTYRQIYSIINLIKYIDNN
jgi:hypothetical protein